MPDCQRLATLVKYETANKSYVSFTIQQREHIQYMYVHRERTGVISKARTLLQLLFLPTSTPFLLFSPCLVSKEKRELTFAGKRVFFSDLREEKGKKGICVCKKLRETRRKEQKEWIALYWTIYNGGGATRVEIQVVSLPAAFKHSFAYTWWQLLLSRHQLTRRLITYHIDSTRV